MLTNPNADDIVAATSFGLWVARTDEGRTRDRLLSYETTPRTRRGRGWSGRRAAGYPLSHAAAESYACRRGRPPARACRDSR